MSPKNWTVPLALSLCAALLAGCGGGGGSGSDSRTGSMTLKLTDAPIDSAEAVVVVFTGVELKPTDGAAFSVDFPSPKSIDVLALQGGKVTSLFENQTVPAGHYDWLRLKVKTDPVAHDASYAMIDGAMHNLTIPSGAETGLKLVRGFTIAQGGATGFIIDFDVRKSMVMPMGGGGRDYLKPALRMMDEMQVGTIAGTVHLTTLAAAQLAAGAPVTDCHAGLYVFRDAAATPDDFDRDLTTEDDGGSDPVYLQPIPNDGVVTDVDFSIPFVEAGVSYTVAATCDFDKDGMDTNDYGPNATSSDPGYQTMRWTTVNDVAVTSGATTTVSVP